MKILLPEFNYTEPDWAPLERAVSLAGLPRETCGEFMWMCEEPQGVHQYKHRDTRKYVKLGMHRIATVCVRELKEARL